MTGTGPPAVRLRSVSKRYARARPVLTDVTLTVWPADVLAIRGANGSGKSTLLRLIAGLSRPSAGECIRTARVVGYVPERFPVHDRMSAVSYLRHLARIRGLAPRAAAGRADEMLARLSLADGADTPVRMLSKGNVQKVALAQALLVPPDLLLLDEPWAGLDASVHETLGELVTEAVRGGCAVICADHREAASDNWATRVCRIADGTLAEAAAPQSAEPSQVMLVELAAPGRSAAIAGALGWPDLPGVVRAAERGRHVILHVRRDSHDALLVTAISRGWSVVGVRPAAPPSARHGAGTPQ